MNAENILFASKTIDMAENDLFIELTNRLCYYDDKNLNNVVLPYKGCEESALAMAKSLIGMPVQAAYRKINGRDDLGSHEARINSDGEMEFLTESVGVHTDVWISDSEVTTVSGETKILPCLFSTKRIWKRNKNMVSAIKRLYESPEGLGSSWEIQTLEYSFKNGIKYLNNYNFLGDCLLGSTTTPAYSGTSKALSMTAEQLMIAEALLLDIESGDALTINENTNKEESILENTVVNTSEVSEEVIETPVVEETVATKTVEENTVVEAETETTEAEDSTSAECKKKKECSKKDGDPEDEEPEDDEEKKCKSETSEIAELNKTIAEKDEIILKASSEITELKARVAELSQYKEKFEKAEQEKIEAELAEKKEELISSVIKSGHMTREEIESSEELKGFVEALDKASLMAIIGERLIASIEEVKTPVVETSETSEKVRIATNLNDSDEEVLKDSASIMRKFLRK